MAECDRQFFTMVLMNLMVLMEVRLLIPILSARAIALLTVIWQLEPDYTSLKSKDSSQRKEAIAR